MEGEGRRSCLHENEGHSRQNLMYKKVYWVPAWEREFTVRIGGLAWERFVEAKKHIDSDSKVMMWNDLAGEEAFREAKNRFWCQYYHRRQDEFNYDYVYVDDNTDWYSKFQEEVVDENLMFVSKDEISQNGGTNNRILHFMLHPVVNIKRYTVNKLLPRTTALTATTKSNL